METQEPASSRGRSLPGWAYRPTPERYRILIEQPAFPSDRYAVVSQLRFHGLDPPSALIEVAPRAGEWHPPEEDIDGAIPQFERQSAFERLDVARAGLRFAAGPAAV